MTEDKMVGWHHQLDGHEFEQALGVGDGQRGLVCCMQSMGSQRVGDDWATEQQPETTSFKNGRKHLSLKGTLTKIGYILGYKTHLSKFK